MIPTNLKTYQPSPYQQGGENVMTLSPSELFSLFKKIITEKKNTNGTTRWDLCSATDMPISTLFDIIEGRIKLPKKKTLIKIQSFISKIYNKTILIDKEEIKKTEKTEKRKYPLSSELLDFATIPLQEKNINIRDNIVEGSAKKKKLETDESNNLYPKFYPLSNNVNYCPPSQQSSINNSSSSNQNFTLEGALTLPSEKEDDSNALLSEALAQTESDTFVAPFLLNTQEYPLPNISLEEALALPPEKGEDGDTLLSKALEPTESDQSDGETNDGKTSQNWMWT